MFDVTENISTNVESESDGGWFWPSSVYDVTVTQCYGRKSTGGSMGLVVEFATKAGKKVEDTFWFISKKTKSIYCAKKKPTDKDKYTPGFITASGLVSTVFSDEYKQFVEKEVSDGASLDVAHVNFFNNFLKSYKVGNVSKYDFKARGRVESEEEFVYDSIVGKQCKAGVVEAIETKNKKGADGNWNPSTETKTVNSVDKLFSIDSFSSLELRGQAETPASITSWMKRFSNKVIDKRLKKYKDMSDEELAAEANKEKAEANEASDDSAFGSAAATSTNTIFG